MIQSSHRYSGKPRIAVAILVLMLTSSSSAHAAEPTKSDRKFIEMQTSINAIMVAMIDWSAHEIWEAGNADTLTGRNWLTTKQYAIELLAAGTLVSLGGTGREDMSWVRDPAWQVWTSQMIEEAGRTLQAIDARDKARLRAAGDQLIYICEGCHAAFKPDSPTEGILHVPHHDYGETLVPD
jgi:hypothetical protein